MHERKKKAVDRQPKREGTENEKIYTANKNTGIACSTIQACPAPELYYGKDGSGSVRGPGDVG